MAGRPAWWWIQLWRRCHELRWVSEAVAQWCRVGWPEDGCVLDQYELTIEIFTVIMDEKTKILVGELKKKSGG